MRPRACEYDATHRHKLPVGRSAAGELFGSARHAAVRVLVGSVRCVPTFALLTKTRQR